MPMPISKSSIPFFASGKWAFNLPIIAHAQGFVHFTTCLPLYTCGRFGDLITMEITF